MSELTSAQRAKLGLYRLGAVVDYAELSLSNLARSAQTATEAFASLVAVLPPAAPQEDRR